MLTNAMKMIVPPGRRAVVGMDNLTKSSGTNPQALSGVHYIRLGDILDVGMNWSQWMEGNHGKIKSSTWSAAAGSPATPTFGADLTLVDRSEQETVVMLDTSAATANDFYWLQNTVIVEYKGDDDCLVLPDRTVSRIMHVCVVL